MDELLTGLGGGSIGVGAIVWYAKSRFLKFDKKISHMAQAVRDATTENDLQKEQITRLREDFNDLKKDYRDLKNKVL